MTTAAATDNKPEVHQIESIESQSPKSNFENDEDFTAKHKRKIIRRIDSRLIVMLGFLHTVSLMDRGNISSASVAGLKEELHLKGMQYVSLYPTFLAIME